MYIGKQPQIGNYQVCDALSASATATYALAVSSVAVFPESANHVICSLNGVIQKPGSSFSISSSNIVFSSALTSSDKPPQRTACSPKRSVSVSSLKFVSRMPARVPPIPFA